MERAAVGTTGISVSKLAFGTMTFGGDADEEASRAMFHRCLEAGIDHFDTADVYNAGRSEEILGRLMEGGLRERLVIATKAYFPSGPGANERGSSRLHLHRALEGSLRRLRTDRVDLFYLHRFDDRTALESSLRAVEDLVRQGKVVYPALSNFAAWQVEKALGIAALRGFAPVVAIQPMYNLVKRQAEVELLPMASSEGLAVFPYSPLGGGLLSGRYGASKSSGPGRLVDWRIYQERYGSSAHMDVADQFVALAEELGVHPGALAIAWVASHPAVTAPLLGARSLGQLEPLLAAADVRLTPEIRGRISSLVPTPPPATDRNEERR